MSETSLRDLKEIASKWITEGWQKGNYNIIDQLHSPDFIDHDSYGRSTDNEGFKSGLINLFKAFPDFYAVIEDLIIDVENNKVAVRWKAEGTHKAEYLGYIPTGRKIRFKGIEVIKIKNNKIIERWGEWDGIDLINQLKIINEL